MKAPSVHIRANVSHMFAEIEPCYASGSQAELGSDAGPLTWRNALQIASARAEWLESDETSACDGMRAWAKETGAWEDENIAEWPVDECLALFVQNVASELRMLGSDDSDLEECVARCATTDWNKECEYPVGDYFVKGGAVHVDYYAGI